MLLLLLFLLFLFLLFIYLYLRNIIFKHLPLITLFCFYFSFNDVKNFYKNNFLLSIKTQCIKTIESYTGFQWFQLLDSFFMGSICLFIFKLSFRLLFFTNAFWYINLVIFSLGIILELKFNLLMKLREKYVNIVKSLVGKNYWEEKSKVKLNHGTLINKLFRKAYILLILFRLYILKNPLIFIFVNILITYYLITNHYFLIASFISFLLILSRLSIFISDYNTKELYEIIKKVENFDERKENIKPTWKNAQIITLIVMRSFEDLAWHKKEKTQDVYENSRLRNIGEKYSQIYTDLIDHYKDDYYPQFIKASKRWARHEAFLNPEYRVDESAEYAYIKVIEIEKKSPYKMLFNGTSVVFGISQTQALRKWYKIDDVMNIFSKYFPPHIFPQAPGHPEIHGIDEKNELLLSTNKTTLKEKDDKTFLAPMPEHNNLEYTGRGILRTTRVVSIPRDEIKALQQEINFRKNHGYQITETTMPKRFVSNDFSRERVVELLKNDTFKSFLQRIAVSNHFIIPEPANCMLAFLNPLVTKQQAINAISETIIHLQLQNQSKFVIPQFKDDNKELIKELEKIKTELEISTDLTFSNTENEDVAIKINQMKEINEYISVKNKQHFAKSSREVIASQYNISEHQAAIENIYNLHRIKTKHGGLSRKEIQFDALKPSHQNQIIIKNSDFD